MYSLHYFSQRPGRFAPGRIAVAFMAVVTSTMSVLALTGVEARAEDAGPAAVGFSLQASADAIKFDIDSGLFGSPFPGMPPGEPPATGSAAHTEAVFDDLGNNSALASAPYPGSFAVGMPGLLRAVARPGGQPGIGQAPPLPNWPFIVTSGYPGREESSQINGPYAITATSGPEGSVAEARAGQAQDAALMSPASRSGATWDPASGNFIARAEASFAVLAIGSALRLGDVAAKVSLAAAPGADAPTSTSSFEVGTMTVGGVKVGLTDKGFLVGPSSQPRPDLGPLAPLLESAGLRVEFLPSEATPTTVVSAGLRISAKQTFPVQGTVEETWTIGRVMAGLKPGTGYGTDDLGGDSFAAFSADEGEKAEACPNGWQRFGAECYPNVAVITPTLGFISFGATFGGPIMCFMATGAAQSIGRGLGAAALANEVGKQVTPYCTSGPNQFGEGIGQVAKALGPLTAINPVVNPVLGQVADGFRSSAQTLGPAIAPFGPTAYEMGAFVEFFKGS